MKEGDQGKVVCGVFFSVPEDFGLMGEWIADCGEAAFEELGEAFVLGLFGFGFEVSMNEVDDAVGAAVLSLAVGENPVETPPFRGLAGVIFKAAVAKGACDLIACATFSLQSRERLDLTFGEWRDGVHFSDAHGLVNRAGLSSAGVACSLPDGKPY